MITGWLSGEDCPGCGGPLLDTSAGPRLLTLACPGCGYTATWHTTDHTPPVDQADPSETEAE
jgi:uncharacterized Zn finger protein (UPF0148 family)